MSTHTQITYVFFEHKYSDDYSKREWKPTLWCFKAEDNDERVFVCETTSTFEMPEGFDPTAKQLAALEGAKAEALRQYTNRVAELNDRIGKLQAIEFAPASEAGYEVDAAGTFKG
jgi:hypothetical protein